jgi:hypothetical protein
MWKYHQSLWVFVDMPYVYFILFWFRGYVDVRISSYLHMHQCNLQKQSHFVWEREKNAKNKNGAAKRARSF